MTIEEFIEKCQKRPLPSNPMTKVKILARELAEGASYELWDAKFKIKNFESKGSIDRYELRMDQIFASLKNKDNCYIWWNLFSINNFANQLIEPILIYLDNRWSVIKAPNPNLLESQGFIETSDGLAITKKAFNLLDSGDETSIFISYKRSESSAFALLLEDRLSQAGLSPFLDKQLQAGDDWHAELEEKIANSDYFLLILGKETLKSSITIKEINWSIEHKKTIIPIWHNSFEFKLAEWLDLDARIAQILGNTHTIRVIEENPLTYDTALRELLNRFGISG